jgi:CubicO group peptidase (beta-lactamase class C family)
MQLNESLAAKERSFHFGGDYDPAFRGVVDAFIENYAIEEEIGSATALMIDGRKVVDVWGGFRDAGFQQSWQADTIVCMMSVAKGISGIAFNILIDRGLVDPEQPVARYWPEFAQNGKEGVLVRHVLDHTLWEPGTTAAYHIHTQGNILGEIVRRMTGKRYPQFIADELVAPLRLDYRIGGLTDLDIDRCAELVPVIEGTLFARKDAEPDSLLAKGFRQHPDEPIGTTLNSTGWKQSEIASANGHGTARSVATIYGAIARGGLLGDITIMRPETVARMITEQHNQTEQMQQRPYHQGLGILLNTEQSVWMGPNPRSFGHHGFGGSIGMGDPDAKLGFSYACNKMHARPDNGPRARRIIEAAYRQI